MFTPGVAQEHDTIQAIPKFNVSENFGGPLLPANSATKLGVLVMEQKIQALGSDAAQRWLCSTRAYLVG